MLLKYKVKLNSDGVFTTTEFLVEPIQELLSSYLQSSEGGVLGFRIKQRRARNNEKK